MKNLNSKRQILLFFLFVTLISGCLEGAFICTRNNLFLVFLMWTPAIMAGILKFFYFRKEKGALLFKKCKIRYLILSCLLPLLYLGIPYVLYWIGNPSMMKVTFSVQLIASIAIGIPTASIATIGEEIGFRGFLLPRLAKETGELKACIFTGVFWGLWHMPLILSGLYIPGVSVWYASATFMIVIVSVGIIIGLITLKSGSVWPAILMHSVHNCLDQDLFCPGTAGMGKYYFAGETGLLTAVVTVLVAILLCYCFYHSGAKARKK